MSDTIETPAAWLREGDIIRLYNFSNARLRAVSTARRAEMSRFVVLKTEQAQGRPALRFDLIDVHGAVIVRYFAATRLITREHPPS